MIYNTNVVYRVNVQPALFRAVELLPYMLEKLAFGPKASGMLIFFNVFPSLKLDSVLNRGGAGSERNGA